MWPADFDCRYSFIRDLKSHIIIGDDFVADNGDLKTIIIGDGDSLINGIADTEI